MKATVFSFHDWHVIFRANVEAFIVIKVSNSKRTTFEKNIQPVTSPAVMLNPEVDRRKVSVIHLQSHQRGPRCLVNSSYFPLEIGNLLSHGFEFGEIGLHVAFQMFIPFGMKFYMYGQWFSLKLQSPNRHICGCFKNKDPFRMLFPSNLGIVHHLRQHTHILTSTHGM